MAQHQIERADTDRVIEVSPGDVIVISLPENVTTGYRWTVGLLDEKAVDLEESRSTMRERGDVGRGNSRTFLFRAKAPGVTPVQFLLRRSWEPKEAAIDQFTMTIQIQANEAP
jgi:inhibitor of cysteine peptidase